MTKDSARRKKIITTVYLTPEQCVKLKVLRQKTRVPVAVYIREAIDRVLEERGGSDEHT